jgi:hypothetical protein
MQTWQNRDWAAVWIDQKMAVVLKPQGEGLECLAECIYSDVEAKHKSTGGRGKSRPFMHENGSFSAKHFERARTQKLEKYFAEISSHLSGTQELLVLGRGPSAQIFAKRWAESRPEAVHFEKADKLTLSELKQHAFAFFGWTVPRKRMQAPGQPLLAASTRGA